MTTRLTPADLRAFRGDAMRGMFGVAASNRILALLDEIDALSANTVEWGVMVPALGDTVPELCADEAEARTRRETPDRKWTHDNPVTLHRRTVTEWEQVD